jgi:transaldolase
MPEATLHAVADHGVVRGDTIAGTYAEAAAVLAGLRDAGIDYDDVVWKLEAEGLAKFEDAWNELLQSIADQLQKAGSAARAEGTGATEHGR